MKKIILSGIVGFALLITGVSLAHATITFTTSKLKATTKAATCALPSLTAAAGSTLVVSSQITTSSVTATIASTNGDTWSQAIRTTSTAGQEYVFYATNINSGATVATITLSASATSSCEEDEYAGVGGALPLDVTSASSSAGSTALISGSSTTNFLNEVLIGNGLASSAAATFTAGASFTIRATSTIGAIEDRIVAATSSYSTPMTIGASAAWIDSFIALIATPTAPGTPTYTNIGSAGLTASWTAGANSTYYSVVRSTSANGTYTQIATTTAVSYADTGLSGNTSYWYKVNGVNVAGSSTYSASSTKLTFPGVPGTPSYSNILTTTLTVSWVAPTGGATSYSIKRATSANGTYSQVSTTAASSYNDIGLTGNTSYWYEINGVNATGNGSSSASSTVKTAVINLPPTAPTEDSPASGTQNMIVTPTFNMSTTDPTSDNLQYKVVVYSDSCSTVVQTDDESVSQTGWSGQNASSGQEYLSGTEGVFTIQSALNPSTIYYWRASAKDPEGSNTWTASAACNNFTTSGGNWTTDSGTWSISSNQLTVAPGAGNYAQLHVAGLSITNDVVEYKEHATSANLGDTGALFRADASSNRYQLGDLDYLDQQHRITKRVSNTNTTISTTARSLAAATVYDVRSYTNGTALKSWVNGIVALSTTDSAFTGAGYIGINASGNNTFSYDDFSIYTSPVITLLSLPGGGSWSAEDHSSTTISCTTGSTWDASTYTGQVPIDYDNGGGKIAVWTNNSCSGSPSALYPPTGLATDIFGGDTYSYGSGGNTTYGAVIASTTVSVSSVGFISN